MGAMVIGTEPQVGGATPERAVQSRRGVLVLGVVLAIAAFATWALWPAGAADPLAGTTAVSAEEITARYGINVTLVAVSAAGGLIDFRYQVVDPDKANQLIHESDLTPVLVAEDTGAAVQLVTNAHNHGTELELGGDYFMLVANTRNAFHQGSQAALVIGDVRLEHLVVQR
jgi:hypothetical protein